MFLFNAMQHQPLDKKLYFGKHFENKNACVNVAVRRSSVVCIQFGTFIIGCDILPVMYLTI